MNTTPPTTEGGRFHRHPSLRAIAPLALALAACGGPGFDSDLHRVEERPASLLVLPSLDATEANIDLDSADVEISELVVNVTEVRLIGSDPRIPAEGLPLITGQQLVSNTEGDYADLELSIPEAFRDDPDLAVYVRVEPAAELDGAAVVVHAQYALFQDRGQSGNVTDPDVDPMAAEEPLTINTMNCGTDRRLIPLLCANGERQEVGRNRVGTHAQSLSFFMRDNQTVDLVTPLGLNASPELIIGVPASLWVSPALFDSLRAADTDDGPLVFDANHDTTATPVRGVVGATRSGYVLRRGNSATVRH